MSPRRVALAIGIAACVEAGDLKDPASDADDCAQVHVTL